MADPLSQLRHFHINGREIKEHNDHIIFGDHGWPKNVNTNYQIYSTEDDKSKKEYYTLDCLLYFLRNKDVGHTHYVRQAGHDQKTVVRRPDRKDLLAYLTGATTTAPNIDKDAPIPAVRLPIADIYKKNQQTSSDLHGGSSSQSSSGGHSQGDRVDAGQSAKKRMPHDEDISKVREEFTARLFEPSKKKMATIIPTDNSQEKNESSAAIRSLGAEKLATLRAKHLAVKRTTIIDADTEPGTGQMDTSGREDLLFAMDAEKFKLIKSKEKVWRTRSSILQAPSKSFTKTVLPMVDILEKSGDPSKKGSSSSQPPPPPMDLSMNPYHQPQPQQQQPAVQKNSYNRYDQERFVKLDIGVEIDTKKSFVGGVSNGLSSYTKPSPTKSAPIPATRPPVIGPGTNNTTPAATIRGMDTVDNRQRTSSGSTPGSRPTKRTSTVPIIIIPATTTSLINMYNASAILQDLTYVDGAASGKPRENEIMIQRKKADGSTAMYKILDNPLKLEPEDWNRVVAVFVQGPAWQFKGWPWGGSPVEIFSRIKGFHLKWDESKLDDNVSKWNVHILELSHTRRHLDKANLLKFWSSLDAFMMKYKSFLRF